jgi:PPE family
MAAELRSTAISHGSIVSELTKEDWRGPASASMAAAAPPYAAWMSTTAAQAAQVLECLSMIGGCSVETAVTHSHPLNETGRSPPDE